MERSPGTRCYRLGGHKSRDVMCAGRVVEWNGCRGWFADADDWSVAWAMGMGGLECGLVERWGSSWV